MARFLFKLIICLLLAGAAGVAYLSMRSGDPLYTFYEFINPARFQKHDALIRTVAAEHQLDPMLVKAVVWRESRFDAQKFGTAGERMLSDPSLLPIWDEFVRARLPLCVHMGMSYPPLAQLGQSIYDGHVIGMSLPAQLAFMAVVGHRMLDRYSDLKVAFLEFGAEWIFYMVSRMDHYLPLDRGAHPFGLSMPNAAQLPRLNIRDYVKSGRIFIAAEADDKMLHQLFELIGEDHVLFSSDFPHGEGRENAALEILERSDLSEAQKRKLLYDNTVRLFGEP